MFMINWLIKETILTEKKFLKTKFRKKSWNCWQILDFNKQQKDKGIKILTPKQMLQRLPIALAQVKTGNTSENVLNEIRYFLYQEKEVTEKSI